MNGVVRWDYDRLGPLSLEAVRALHQPAERFRVTPSRYPAGTAFAGTARVGRRYILAGACVFTLGEGTWELHAGDIVDLPEGDYQFRVLGGEPVELVTVWALPPEVWISRRQIRR